MFSAISSKVHGSDVTATAVSPSARGSYSNGRRSNSSSRKGSNKEEHTVLSQNSRTILAAMQQQCQETVASSTEPSISGTLEALGDSVQTGSATVILSKGDWQNTDAKARQPSSLGCLVSDVNAGLEWTAVHQYDRMTNGSPSDIAVSAAAATVDCVGGSNENNGRIVFSAASENGTPPSFLPYDDGGCLQRQAYSSDLAQNRNASSSDSIKRALVSSFSSSYSRHHSDAHLHLSNIACNPQTIVDMESTTYATAVQQHTVPIFTRQQQRTDQHLKEQVFGQQQAIVGTDRASGGSSTGSTTPQQQQQGTWSGGGAESGDVEMNSGEEDDDRPAVSEHGESSEQTVAPIRSLTALALSPTQQQQQEQQQEQQRQQGSNPFIGGGDDGNNDDEPDNKGGATGADGSGTMLQSLMERVQNIEQYCRQLVEMQSQQAQHISALETTIQNTAATRTLSPQPAGAMNEEGSSATVLVRQTRGRSRGPAVSAGITAVSARIAAVSARIPSAAVMHEAASAFGSQQGMYQTQYPQHQSQIDASIQYPQQHHRRGSAGLYQHPSAGYHSATPTSASPGGRLHPYGGRAGPYSARTSPTERAQIQRPTALVLADAGVGRSRDALYSAASSDPSSPGHRRLELSPPSAESTRTRPFNAPAAAQSRRGSSAAQHYRSTRHQLSPSLVSRHTWTAPQQQQHGAMYSALDESRHVVAPYAMSAFGYTAASASAGAHAGATGVSSRSGGGGGEQHSISQQLYAAGSVAATRAKRARVAESTAAAAATGQYSSETTMHVAPQGALNVLPPIRSSIDPASAASVVGGAAGAPGAAGRIVAEDQRSSDRAQTAKERKGRMVADEAGRGSGSRSGGANPEALPTPQWLTSQRRYKVGLLHLLTLESFYPSDVAMLNTFREQDDFTDEQIERHGATLLSWARSWLRYNRNAVLRNTLENKAKAPLTQLAETLQHDLHAETDFTVPHYLRRCALLRLIYYQWQAINKLGTKSQSLYRDYETRLREIDALPTQRDKDADWSAILEEEQARRLALIRESRATGVIMSIPPVDQQGAAVILPRPPVDQISGTILPRPQLPVEQQGMLGRHSAVLQQSGPPAPMRPAVLDWSAHLTTAMSDASPNYAVATSMGSPGGQIVGKDDGSEMSVKLSPENPPTSL